MALKRTKLTLGSSASVSPNFVVIGETDVSKIEFIGAFFEALAATKIILQEKVSDEWFDYEEMELGAGDYDFFNIWSAPFEKIRFISSNPTTVNWQLTLKT